MVRERHGRRAYDWKYWPIAIVILAMVIAGLSAKIAWGEQKGIKTYWTLPPGSCRGYDCWIPVEGDVATMDVLRNCLELYKDDEKILIEACVEPHNIKAFLAESGGLPLTTETAEQNRMGAYFLGKVFSDIWKRYPELENAVELIDNGDGTFTERKLVTEQHFQGCQ